MHTTKYNNNIVFLHNKDYSGELTIRIISESNTVSEMRLPFEAVKELVLAEQLGEKEKPELSFEDKIVRDLKSYKITWKEAALIFATEGKSFYKWVEFIEKVKGI